MAWPYLKLELNRTAAFFYGATFLLTCTALLQPSWFRMGGGMECHLAPLQVFSSQSFSDKDEYNSRIISFGNGNVRPLGLDSLLNLFSDITCLTPKIASLLRALVLLCIFILILSLVGIFINLSASSHRFIKMLRKNAVPSILSVFCVIIIIGISYYITVVLEFEISSIIREPVYVAYEYGFFTVTVAGGFALLASATNLWGELTPRGDIQRRNLMDDWDEHDIGQNESTYPSRPALPPYSARPPNFTPRIVRQSQNGARPAEPNNIDTYYPFDDLSNVPPPPPYSP